MNKNCCGNSKVMVGNLADVDIKNKQLFGSAEIRSDIIIEKFNANQIWGQAINCKNNIAQTRLGKLYYENGQNFYQRRIYVSNKYSRLVHARKYVVCEV